MSLVLLNFSLNFFYALQAVKLQAMEKQLEARISGKVEDQISELRKTVVDLEHEMQVVLRTTIFHKNRTVGKDVMTSAIQHTSQQG